MRQLRVFLTCFAVGFVWNVGEVTASAAERARVEDGQTQIVAKIGRREITIYDLRSEMQRLGLPANAAESEKLALQSIVQRRLLVDAARDANLHRSPDALRAIARAQDVALADLYLSSASRPPDPTNDEIEAFIDANPAMFARREMVEFLVLTLPSDAYNEEEHTPLFDTSLDFVALEENLRRANVEYSITPVRQPTSAFPKEIREQLSVYRPNDNIVIKSDPETQLMKITSKERAAIARSDAFAQARINLLNERATARAENLVESLKRKTKLTYYRASAAPTDRKE